MSRATPTHKPHLRRLIGKGNKLFCTDKVYEQLYSKHFKKQYAGKPTKRYLKLWKKLREAGEVSQRDLLNYLK